MATMHSLNIEPAILDLLPIAKSNCEHGSSRCSNVLDVRIPKMDAPVVLFASWRSCRTFRLRRFLTVPLPNLGASIGWHCSFGPANGSAPLKPDSLLDRAQSKADVLHSPYGIGADPDNHGRVRNRQWCPPACVRSVEDHF